MTIALPAFRAALSPSWGKNELWRKARAVPSLDLRFAENKSLVDATTGANLVTFTRASSGTYVDSEGVIRQATTNLLLRSEEFGTTWVGEQGTVTANQATAPNGTLTADDFEDTGSASGLYQLATITANTIYTASIYLKRGDTDWYRLYWVNTGFTDGIRVWVNLTTGALGAVNTIGTASNQSGSIVSVGDGWYRVSITGTIDSSSTTGRFQINSAAADNSGTRVLNANAYIWGAQLEQSSTVGEYIPTTSTINSAPRFDHNPTTGESLGLLVEEQRTNLVTNSSAIGAATGTPGTLPTSWESISGATGLTSEISGIGTENGIPYVDFRFYGTTGNNFLTIVPLSGAVGFITSTAYTASIYTKLVAGGIPAGLTASLRIRYNLSPSGSTDIANSFSILNTGSLIGNRFTSTGTTAGTLTGSGLVFLQLNYMLGQVVDFTIRVGYPQLERGAFATSVIPTSGSAATRAADVASISGSNFSSWYRQDEGSVYCEASVGGADKGLWSIGDPTLAFGSRNSFYATNASGAGGQFIVSQAVNGVSQISSSACAGTFVLGVFLKTGFGFATNNTVGAGGGLVGVTDTLCNVPTGTFTLSLGSFASGWNASSGSISGHIRRFVFWPRRLPNTALQTITQ